MSKNHYWMSSYWSRIVIEVLVIVPAVLFAIITIITIGVSSVMNAFMMGALIPIILTAFLILMVFGAFWRLGDIAQNTERIASAMEEMKNNDKEY